MVLVGCLLLLDPLWAISRAMLIADSFEGRAWMLRFAEAHIAHPTVSRVNAAENGRPHKIVLYTPAHGSRWPTFIFVHGLLANGAEDVTLNFFAKELATIGFRVVIPEIPSEQRMRMSMDSLTDIGDAIQWTNEQFGQPISLMGFSFGGGLALRAAALPQYAGMLRSVLVVSGYNSMVRMDEFYSGLPTVGPDGRSVQGSFPQARYMMALQHTADFVPADDVPAVEGALERLLHDQVLTDEAKADVMASLTPQQRAEIDGLASNAPEVVAKFVALYTKNKREYDEISPRGHLAGVRAPVFIMHGLRDNVIPVTEAEWNVKELQDNGREVHLYQSLWMRHVLLSARIGWGGKMKLCLFLARALHRAE